MLKYLNIAPHVRDVEDTAGWWKWKVESGRGISEESDERRVRGTGLPGYNSGRGAKRVSKRAQ